MKIKSLLLGSAAALVAVSGAQAADAIIVEPEPMEYVKVCDMYGAGFFYIPGTETCLKFGGHVRIDYDSNRYHGDHDYISNHNTRIRAQLDITANNETEYGTLGSSMSFRGGWMNESYIGPYHDLFSVAESYNTQTNLMKATINLAGFRMGYDAVGGGAWNRYGGYGYYNARNSGLYGFQTALFLEYGGSAGGFNYVVGIQDALLSGSSGQPDVYAGMNTTMGGLSLAAVVMYDSNGGWDGGATGTYEGDGGIAYRVRADYDLSSFLPGGSIGAWHESDNGDTDYVKGHRWGVTMKANLTDKLVGYTGYSAYNGEGLNEDVDLTHWVAGVRWNVVSGLYIQGEWAKTMREDGWFGEEDSQDRFSLRIHRSF